MANTGNLNGFMLILVAYLILIVSPLIGSLILIGLVKILIQTSQDAMAWTTVGSMTGGDGGFDRIICPAINVRCGKMQGIKIAGNGASYDILEFRISAPPNIGALMMALLMILQVLIQFSPSTTTTYTVIIPDQLVQFHLITQL